ncbi:MAG: flagellar hook-associated protein FlgK [Haliea sp.]|uniref:flagellar hook-associated protein FlgK n=1 Tax=Haliea sp. TaxID=1932666 RepID=UPI0032EFBC8C
MADLLNIGTSALLSLQRALSTTGQNIANVNTAGYSRQRVDFATLPPEATGAGFLGTGVKVDSITRSYDQFLAQDVRSRSSSSAGFSTLASLTSRIDSLLADPSVGIAPGIESFFGALQDVANTPGSIPERKVLLGEASELAGRFQALDAQLRGLNSEVSQRITTTVQDINALASNIASLNEQVVRATTQTGGQPPNDLLDARDQAINRLAEKVGVTTVMQDDGAINVLVGNGQALVVGFTASELQTFRDPFDATRVNVGIAGLATSTDIGRFLSGGELGAALSFRGGVLDSTRNELGLLAAGIAATFNAQHSKGLDLNGQLGGNFFRPLEPAVTASAGNTGSATVSAGLADVGALTGADYRISFDGSQWTLRNQQTGASQTGAGPAFSVDGVDITISGTPAAGDSFLIQPVAQGANLFALEITNAAAFAAASPVRSSSGSANLGDGGLSALSVNDASGLPLAGAITLTFNPDALGAGIPGYDVAGSAGGPIAYNPATDSGGIAVTLGGLSFELAGTPAAGDTLGIANNTDGSGDNRNALSLGALQAAPILDGGTASYQDSYAGLVADVAVRSRQASAAADAEGTLLQQAISARDSVQGVNLDEEAADLLRYQQAYQAAAQVISVADTVFQTLLDATRR